MVDNILKNEEHKEKYRKKMFTENGEKTLLAYVKTLGREYLKKKEADYPFRMGIVLGIPLFHYAQDFENKEMLMSRIKGFAQLVGITQIEVELTKDSKAIIDFNKTEEK